jgi:2-polyprenyl-3-methyl-5-hydroxy-6-metoxy-1,4-benzoquinol methylase
MKCNYCGDRDFEIITHYTRFEKHDVLQCRKCGLVFLKLDADKEKVEEFYSDEYRKIKDLPIQSPEEHFNDPVTRNDSDNRIKFILSRTAVKGKAVLEIGSATGGLLEKLKEQGCQEIAGVELGKEFSDYASQRGFNIFTRSLEELDLKNKYDVIVTFHTMEHVYDPKAVFGAVYAALKPGGWFLGEVPNQNDWRIQIFHDELVKRLHYDPNHYYYFSPETLTNYLKTSGFSGIEMETVERYNSLVQLRNILSGNNQSQNINETMKKYVFPKNAKEDVRLPDFTNEVETRFNQLYGNAVNADLMGNCLHWVTRRALPREKH